MAACVTGVGEQLDLRASRLIVGRGGAEELAPLVRALLAEAAWCPREIDVVAVVCGPGSFTGLRASLALAHGVALGSGAVVLPVTVGEALAPALMAEAADRGLTRAVCVLAARRGRVFLDEAGVVTACALDGLTLAREPVLLAGNAAESLLDGASASSAQLSKHHAPDALMIAAAALRRARGDLPPRAPLPLYVEAAEAKLPAGGLRPAPKAGS
nr:tRNA (adenosine(37)-N6)-threonylcarbamoyltransferase complex dimerization subunit type 1 TsaB [Ameyamaea chiangmaiensis]